MPPHDRIARTLAAIVRHRALVLVVYGVLLPVAIYAATRIPSDSGIDRLIVPSDPDFEATRAYDKLFPEPPIAFLVFESDDPWSPSALARIGRAQTALSVIPHVTPFTALDAIRRARPTASIPELEQLALGTSIFRAQNLVGDHFMSIVASLDVHGSAERDAALDAIDLQLARAGALPVRKVGTPYVSSWIERATAEASARAFPVFGVLLVVIAVFLFRSIRALGAIVIALSTAVALAVAAGGLLGFTFTIVSVLVPLTIMVTTLASLVYLHARYIDQPADVPLAEHHLAALRNKFLPVTASTLAAAMGFGALAVSRIRPIREMGIWTAVGLAIAWVTAFTLFPALQLALRTPTGTAVAPKHRIYERLARAIPSVSYRLRWPFVIGALAACAIGVLVLFGLPGVISGASVETDPLSTIDPDAQVARDLRWFRANVGSTDVARVWIHLATPTATDPAVLQAVENFTHALEIAPEVSGVVGPTTMLRMRSYVAGKGEVLPSDPAGFAAAVADFEELLLAEPELRIFVDAGGLSDLQLTLQLRRGDAEGYAATAARVDRAWLVAKATTPVLAGAHARLVGEALLQAKVGANLVPTLAESFLLTAGLIFAVFLVLFRSGVERLLAMIPSLFALLVTFLGMRAFGGSLNVATIIIATTVLGTTENDQIHFFHHMHELGADATLDDRLAHALRVSGRAIVFATLINAAGFLGLSISSFPPLRQFGLMTSSAFVLALLADFTALPAALWIASRARPRETAPR
jgi:predicted RND superfamily exporter protein